MQVLANSYSLSQASAITLPNGCEFQFLIIDALTQWHASNCTISTRAQLALVHKHYLTAAIHKLRGLSPRANYTDREAAAGRRS